jgi:hypothetical protein
MARPTKFNQARAAAICDALRKGATRKAAAEANGITYDCLLDWLHAGEKAQAGPFFQFFQSVTCAEADAENTCSASLLEAAPKDWRAAEAWLKRRRREEWGDSQQVTFLQKVAAEVEKMSDAELLEFIARTGGGEPDSTGDRSAARANGSGKH